MGCQGFKGRFPPPFWISICKERGAKIGKERESRNPETLGRERMGMRMGKKRQRDKEKEKERKREREKKKIRSSHRLEPIIHNSSHVIYNGCSSYPKPLLSFNLSTIAHAKTKTSYLRSMLFKDIIGQAATKRRLISSVKEGRVSHAQLFLGPEGSGTLALALAYAQYIACENKQENDSCGQCSSCRQIAQMAYPDLHLLYPQHLVKKVEDAHGRGAYLLNFREAVINNAYLSLSDWYQALDLENQQGIIVAPDVHEVLRKLTLKSFSGGYKICIVWYPEKMNIIAANILLKILEEPPDKTLFIFVAEHSDQLLATIQSRLQLIKIPRLNTEDIIAHLTNTLQVDAAKAKSIAHLSEGNYNDSLTLLEGGSSHGDIMKVRDWFLYCFQGKMVELLDWIDVEAKTGREHQMAFFLTAMHVVRESFLISSGCAELVRLEGDELVFAQRFSKMIHGGNVDQIIIGINKAHYHISRNASAKLVFVDLSYDLGRLLQTKA